MTKRVYHPQCSANVTEQPDLLTDAWSNAFLTLYRNNDADVLHQCGGSHPAPRSVVIAGDEDSEHMFGDNTIAKKVKPAQKEEDVRIADCDQCQTTMVLEQCGDPHPAPKPALATNPPNSGDPEIVQDAAVGAEVQPDSPTMMPAAGRGSEV